MTVKVSKPAINVREELADLKKPTGIAGEAMLRAETPQEQFQLIGAGRRNLIINGAMQVAQRSISESVSTSDGYKTLDRFQYNEMGNYSGVHTMSQASDGPSGFATSLKFLCTVADTSLSATDGFSLRYRIEGQDLQGLGYGSSDAKPCTISFWVKSNVTGRYTLNVQQPDASKELTHYYYISSSGVWEYKTITFVGNPSDVINNDTGIGMFFQWGLATGPSWTSSEAEIEWTALNNARRHGGQTADVGAAVNNYWQITGIQLEVGPATPFEHRSYGEELALCQRYYQDHYNPGTYRPFMWTGVTNGSGHTHYGSSLLPVAMRTTPTVAVLDQNKTAFGNISAQPNPNVVRFYAISTGANSRALFECRFTADAEL